MAEIAALNHSRVEGATRTGWDQIPDGSLVLPVDDDDWFAPIAATRAAGALQPRSAGVRWSTTHVQVPNGIGHRVYLWRRRFLPSSPPAWTCSTNNYAMVKGPRDNKRLLASHPEASRWLAAGELGSMAVLPEPLSIANRTIASQSALGAGSSSISQRALLRRLRGYRRLYRRQVRGCPWAAPYLASMDELETRG
ncbi:MAG: hypothetical protein EXQ70_05380 [Solirubrobacterales bacterium]|nr:hypothetical protein [Solirubrobacterales bacterium]